MRAWWLLVGLLAWAAPSAADGSDVLVLDVNGVIGPTSAEIIQTALAQAETQKAGALVLRLDTPGGLDDSMRKIVKGILASPVPVIVYVAPDGSRAASAGVFITYAAHVAAMAPGTNLGAAHPVSLGGEQADETMLAKVTNDAVAYIRSLAALRGRNGDWAEKAVRESVSITADEAKKEGVVDLVAPDLPALLAAVDGRTVRTVMGETTLHTAGAAVAQVEIPWHKEVLALLANPNVAYVLLMLGMYGIIFELSNPGLVLPGVAGAICLLLAFYAFSALPVSYAGVGLILLALALFLAEFFVPAFGALTSGGVVALILGSMMLMDTDVPFLQISRKVLVPVTLFTVGMGVMAAVMAIRAHRRQPVSGEEGMIGRVVTLEQPLGPEGRIWLEGEAWKARADAPLPAGTRVRVTGFDGLTVLLAPQEPQGPGNSGAGRPRKEKHHG
jgi:membrane-bound serine protease (ClpP class)